MDDMGQGDVTDTHCVRADPAPLNVRAKWRAGVATHLVFDFYDPCGRYLSGGTPGYASLDLGLAGGLGSGGALPTKARVSRTVFGRPAFL